MAIHDLKGQIARLPEQPGVYLFLGSSGDTLYVGKARVLRDRVRNYLGAGGTSPRIDALLRDAAALEVIVTDSVVEALALENRLIKQRSPRFNVLLRDDKTYPYLQLTTTERAPRLLVARRVERDGNVYAGPFMPASVARRTMGLAHRLFGIRSCNEIIDGRRDRPCLEYDIKRCLAPCVESVCSIERYRHAADQARLLIEGRQHELVDALGAEMSAAAAEERFERAAQLRDAIRTIETLSDRHNKVESPAFGDRDVFGLKVGPAGAVVAIFQMRRGRVVDRVELTSASDAVGGSTGLLPASDAISGVPSEAEILDAALREFYADHAPPPEIHVPIEPAAEDREAIEAWLAVGEGAGPDAAPSVVRPGSPHPEPSSRGAGRRVRLVVPQRGDKRGLLDLATRNAAMAYQTHFGDTATTAFEALDTLRGVLALPALPRRIECFDISTLQGRDTVASMVVCIEGRMRPGEYRKFKIKGQARDRALGTGPWAQASTNAEPATSLDANPEPSAQRPAPDLKPVPSAQRPAPDLKPVPSAQRPAPDLEPVPSAQRPVPDPAHVLDDYASMYEVVLRRYRRLLEQGGPFPDLVLIDGGKGQLSAAYTALREVGLDRLVAVGLAKEEELLFTRDRAEGMALPASSPALRLVQRIRDEAHRFAVTFHRQSRTKRDLHSALDDVAGIGPRRRKQLLTRFGSVAGVRRASRDELAGVVGVKAADAVIAHFSK